MSSISHQGGDGETAGAIARPASVDLDDVPYPGFEDRPSPLDQRRHCRLADSHRYWGLCRGHSQLLQRCDPGSGDYAYPSAGDDRNSRLEP